ncbi:MAG: pyridoxamine 5'-phosphate oxidase family protein [Acidimicrobiales bacterium]
MRRRAESGVVGRSASGSTCSTSVRYDSKWRGAAKRLIPAIASQRTTIPPKPKKANTPAASTASNFHGPLRMKSQRYTKRSNDKERSLEEEGPNPHLIDEPRRDDAAGDGVDVADRRLHWRQFGTFECDTSGSSQAHSSPTQRVMTSPSKSEHARTLLAGHRVGTLATIDADGRPILSRVPFVDDGDGSPVIVLDNLSAHVLRARQDHRASFSLDDGLLLQGDIAIVPGLEQLALQPTLLEQHPSLATAAESIDYSWYRLIPERARFMGADGEEWLSINDLAGAEPDTVMLAGAELVERVREAIADDALLLVKSLGGRWLATEAELTAIDRYGLRFDVTEPAGRSHGRVAFPERLTTGSQVHAAVGGLVQAARLSPTASASRLLDGVERYRGGGADIDRIDRAGHGDLGANRGATHRGLGEAWTFGTEEDSDGLFWIEPQGVDIDSLMAGGQSDGAEAMIEDNVEAVGERVESGVGEGERLTHGDAA